MDVVIAQGPSIFQLFPGEDQALLVWWYTLFVLDLRLDIVDCVGRLDFEGDGFAREGFDKAERRMISQAAGQTRKFRAGGKIEGMEEWWHSGLEENITEGGRAAVGGGGLEVAYICTGGKTSS